MSALNALCVQFTHDLFAIAKFFYRLAHGGGGTGGCPTPCKNGGLSGRVKCPGGNMTYTHIHRFVSRKLT